MAKRDIPSNSRLELKRTIYRFRFFLIFVAIMIVIIAAINEFNFVRFFYIGSWVIILVFSLIRLYKKPKYKYSGSAISIYSLKTIVAIITIALCFLFLRLIYNSSEACIFGICFDVTDFISTFGTLFLLPILIFSSAKLSDYILKRRAA